MQLRNLRQRKPTFEAETSLDSNIKNHEVIEGQEVTGVLRSVHP